MRQKVSAYLAVLATMLFWGVSFVSSKINMTVFGPMTLGAARFAIAVVILFIVKRLVIPKEKIALRDLPRFAIAGISGITLYFFCENNGVALVSASEASIITGAIPVIMVVIQTVKSLRQKTAAPHTASAQSAEGRRIVPAIIGALISMAGVVMVAGVSISVSGSVTGYVFMAATCACWVAYSLLTEPLCKRYSRLCIVFWQTVFGLAGFLPFVPMELPLHGTVTTEVILHLLFLGIFCSALAYFFYADAMHVLGVGLSSIFINLIPVVTAAAGFLMLGERLSPLQWLGAALVIGGVYVSTGTGFTVFTKK
jgi:drug/metabolite transporter (DMT)-like permease